MGKTVFTHKVAAAVCAHAGRVNQATERRTSSSNSQEHETLLNYTAIMMNEERFFIANFHESPRES
jgi:hypothetical protein